MPLQLAGSWQGSLTVNGDSFDIDGEPPCIDDVSAVFRQIGSDLDATLTPSIRCLGGSEVRFEGRVDGEAVIGTVILPDARYPAAGLASFDRVSLEAANLRWDFRRFQASGRSDGYPNFGGEAIVASVSGSSSCVPWLTVGQRLRDVRWWVTVDPIESTFDIFGDPLDGPYYSGKLEGHDFADTYVWDLAPGDPMGDCDFRESSIKGTFSGAYDSFEAVEVQKYGPPSNELRIVLRHQARLR